MVIFGPRGDELGPTRAPAFEDEAYRYLTSLDLAEV
jgi:hypothetical protein